MSVLLVVAINKLLTAVAVVNLYQLAWIYGGRPLAVAASVLFLFNPSSVFYHSVYSEPLFACLTMIAVKHVLLKRSQSTAAISQPLQFLKLHWKTLLLFSLSISVRSTGLFLSLVFGFPILF